MIIDVLFDALHQIEKYQQEFNDSYGGLAEEIGVARRKEVQ